MEPRTIKASVNNEQWQKKLLPFMTRAIILMAIFFFVASLLQVAYLNIIISTAPKFDAKEALSLLKIDSTSTNDQVLYATRLKSLILLEDAALANQYHQANVLLMAKLWTSYIGFVTGMILAITGAAFILGKLIEPVSTLDASTAGNKLSFKSASPGLMLCVLGATLMITTIAVHHEVNTMHSAIYISDQPIDNSGSASLPQLPFLPEPRRSNTEQKKDTDTLPGFPDMSK